MREVVEVFQNIELLGFHMHRLVPQFGLKPDTLHKWRNGLFNPTEENVKKINRLNIYLNEVEEIRKNGRHTQRDS